MRPEPSDHIPNRSRRRGRPVLSIAALLFSALGVTSSLSAQTAPGFHVAIYRDKGVWPAESTRALPALLDWLGATYRWVSATDINAGVLRSKGKPVFDLLLVPGGWAGDYITKVGGWNAKGRGDDEIRDFVKAGGGYLGFCAGAFAAASTTRWVGKDYAYTWRLFDGYAIGPLKWNPLTVKGYLGAVHGTAVLDLKAAEFKGRGLSAKVRPTLYGGPHFVLRDKKSPPPGYKVLATHGEDGSAAIITFRYPTSAGGRVVLCSFHPSVLTGDGALYDRDPETLAAYGAGKDPDGEAPDLRLAGALVEIAAGIKARRTPLPMLRVGGTVTVPSRVAIGSKAPIAIQQTGSAAASYILCAALDVAPGIRVTGDLIMPLTFDHVLIASLQAPAIFSGFAGKLDAKASASATLIVPSLVSLRGLSLYLAFITHDSKGWRAASAPRQLVLY